MTHIAAPFYEAETCRQHTSDCTRVGSGFIYRMSRLRAFAEAFLIAGLDLATDTYGFEAWRKQNCALDYWQ